MAEVTTRLRILATTDLHMNLHGYDYAADVQREDRGLSGLAPLIAKARSEIADDPCILLDNGDFLQGTQLADWLTGKADHPLVLAFNALRYDAIGLGNHDLDYGLAELQQVIRQLNAPVISTNLEGAQVDGLLPAILLSRQITAADRVRQLKVGILSALPPETALWNARALSGGATLATPATAIAAAARTLRAEGADVIVVLAHMGLGHDDTPASSGNAGAVEIARLPEIDAVIAGHTHRRFPAQDGWTLPPDIAVPVVMPGVSGSDLGVIDLHLTEIEGRWQITQRHAHLRSPTIDTTPDPAILRLAAPAHSMVRRVLAEPVAHVPQALHSYFALVQPALTMAHAARAKASVIERAVAGTDMARLPLLATAAARAVGGPDGAANFVDIPAGPVLRRQLGLMSPFANQFCALVVSSAQLHVWLERSAEVFHGLGTGPARPLLNAARPVFSFDAIYGLTYRIDLTRPVGSRILDLRHAGKRVTPGQEFLLATNTFRANGGGGYDRIGLPKPVHVSDTPPQDGLIGALNSDRFSAFIDTAPWTLEPSGVQAWFDTGPGAQGYLHELARFAPRTLERTPDGFDRIEITV
jgi:2',3'-cyclic-nucleotide 2'-phosphodiesterase / 3'-nucleotidase